MTDVGSTKLMVMEWMENLPEGVHIIGGHPMRIELKAFKEPMAICLRMQYMF